MAPKILSRCVVNGCQSKDVICHRFPNPRTSMSRLLNCLEIVGFEYSDPNTVYSKKYICAVHFTSDFSSHGTKRLNANDYPSINLPNDNNQVSLVVSDFSTAINMSPVICEDYMTDVNNDNQLQSTEQSNLDESFMSGVNFLDNTITDLIDVGNTNERVSANVTTDTVVVCSYVNKHAKIIECDSLKALMKPASASTMTKKDQGLLASIGVKKYSSLTPRRRKMYAVTNRRLRNYRRMVASKKLFKSRFQAAENLANTFVLDIISIVGYYTMSTSC